MLLFRLTGSDVYIRIIALAHLPDISSFTHISPSVKTQGGFSKYNTHIHTHTHTNTQREGERENNISLHP